MEDMLVGKNRVPRDAVKKSLKHTLPSGDHGCIFLRLGLFHSIITYGLLGRYRGYNERRVQLDEVVAQRLEFRVPVVRFRSLG